MHTKDVQISFKFLSTLFGLLSYSCILGHAVVVATSRMIPTYLIRQVPEYCININFDCKVFECLLLSARVAWRVKVRNKLQIAVVVDGFTMLVAEQGILRGTNSP